MDNVINIDVNWKTIGDLALWLKSGKFALPSFQREFVWRDGDIKEFVDSILRGYPVGVVILWKPSDISTVDPFSKPLVGNDISKAEYLILDGQQRLTAILLMYNDWLIKRLDEVVECTGLRYNPDSNRLTVGGKGGVDLSLILRAVSGDGNAYRTLMDRYSHHGDKLLNLGNRIKNYKVPIYILETQDENEKITVSMTEAFIRINKEGVRIGSLELMLSYLGGYIGGEFSNRIRQMHNKYEKDISLSLQPLLRFVFSNFGIRMTDIKPENIKPVAERLKRIPISELKATLDNSQKSLDVLKEFLKHRLGISNLEILPSQITLIPIAKYFYTSDVSSLDTLSDKELEKIEKWFVLANFWGHYSSGTDRKLEKDLEVVKDADSFPLEKLLSNMKSFRTKTDISYDDIKRGLYTNVLLKAGRNYLFILYVLLVKNNATNWAGKSLKDCNYKSLDKHHIFPREFLRERLEFESADDEKVKINNLGNITFIDHEEDIRISNRDPYEYLREYQSQLEKHFIPTNEELWKVKNYEDFLNERINLIYDAGKRFFDFFV